MTNSSSDLASSNLDLDIGALREAISEEYKVVAESPQQGFHFHTGRPLARILEYAEDWLAKVPEAAIESFAGTGNPFSLGTILPGERVVDIGSGAGIDSLIASEMVGTEGLVVRMAEQWNEAKVCRQAQAVHAVGDNRGNGRRDDDIGFQVGVFVQNLTGKQCSGERSAKDGAHAGTHQNAAIAS